MFNINDWEGKNTMVLNHQSDIEELPDLSSLQSITKLKLKHCKNLKRIGKLPRSLTKISLQHSGIEEFPNLGEFQNLTELELEHCKNLKRIGKLPRSLTKISLCSNEIEEFPDLSKFENLREFYCTGTENFRNIEFLPRTLTKIELSYSGKGQINFNSFENLIDLNIREFEYNNHLKIGSFPRNIKKINLELRSIEELPDLSTLNNLKELTIINSMRLKKIGNFPRSLTKIDISNCGIEELPDLSGLENLTELELYALGNLEEIGTIPPNVTKINLDDCINVRKLNLSGVKRLEKIDKLPSSLMELNLSKIESTELLRQIRGLDNLETLDVSDIQNLKMSDFEYFFKYKDRCQNLKVLRARNLPFKYAPKVIGDLKRLRVLDISLRDSSSQVEYVHGHPVNKLINEGNGQLEELSSKNIGLTELSPYIEKHSNLEIFNVNDNKITTLPPVGKLGKLKRLFIKNTDIQNIPQDVLEHKTIEEIDISGTQKLALLDPSQQHETPILESSSQRHIFPSVKIFRANNTKAKDLGKIIANLKKIEHLDISGNDVKLPDDIHKKLPNLHTLIASNTNMEGLPSGLRKTRISHLDISGNPKLVEALQNIHYSSNLRHLNISDCGLTQMPLSKGLSPECKVIAGETQNTVTKKDLWRNTLLETTCSQWVGSVERGGAIYRDRKDAWNYIKKFFSSAQEHRQKFKLAQEGQLHLDSLPEGLMEVLAQEGCASIDLSNCGLQEIDLTPLRGTQIKEINLDKNALEWLPCGLFDLSSECSRNLKANPLSKAAKLQAEIGGILGNISDKIEIEDGTESKISAVQRLEIFRKSEKEGMEKIRETIIGLVDDPELKAKITEHDIKDFKELENNFPALKENKAFQELKTLGGDKYGQIIEQLQCATVVDDYLRDDYPDMENSTAVRNYHTEFLHGLDMTMNAAKASNEKGRVGKVFTAANIVAKIAKTAGSITKNAAPQVPLASVGSAMESVLGLYADREGKRLQHWMMEMVKDPDVRDIFCESLARSATLMKMEQLDGKEPEFEEKEKGWFQRKKEELAETTVGKAFDSLTTKAKETKVGSFISEGLDKLADLPSKAAGEFSFRKDQAYGIAEKTKKAHLEKKEPWKDACKLLCQMSLGEIDGYSSEDMRALPLNEKIKVGLRQFCKDHGLRYNEHFIVPDVAKKEISKERLDLRRAVNELTKQVQENTTFLEKIRKNAEQPDDTLDQDVVGKEQEKLGDSMSHDDMSVSLNISQQKEKEFTSFESEEEFKQRLIAQDNKIAAFEKKHDKDMGDLLNTLEDMEKNCQNIDKHNTRLDILELAKQEHSTLLTTHEQILENQARQINVQRQTLKEHNTRLNIRSESINDHTNKLNELGKSSDEQTLRLNKQDQSIGKHTVQITAQEQRIEHQHTWLNEQDKIIGEHAVRITTQAKTSRESTFRLNTQAGTIGEHTVRLNTQEKRLDRTTRKMERKHDEGESKIWRGIQKHEQTIQELAATLQDQQRKIDEQEQKITEQNTMIRSLRVKDRNKTRYLISKGADDLELSDWDSEPEDLIRWPKPNEEAQPLGKEEESAVQFIAQALLVEGMQDGDGQNRQGLLDAYKREIVKRNLDGELEKRLESFEFLHSKEQKALIGKVDIKKAKDNALSVLEELRVEQGRKDVTLDPPQSGRATSLTFKPKQCTEISLRSPDADGQGGEIKITCTSGFWGTTTSYPYPISTERYNELTNEENQEGFDWKVETVDPYGRGQIMRSEKASQWKLKAHNGTPTLLPSAVHDRNFTSASSSLHR